jgi:hypothetical protein
VEGRSMGSSLTESPPNVKEFVINLLRQLHFQTYKNSYILDT